MHRSLEELSREQQRGFIHGELTVRPTFRPRFNRSAGVAQIELRNGVVHHRRGTV
jgi:hypothetical protein